MEGLVFQVAEALWPWSRYTEELVFFFKGPRKVLPLGKVEIQVSLVAIAKI